LLKSNKLWVKHTKPSAIDYIFLAPLFFYIIVVVFEGALRYYLWHKNLETLIYIPKALMFCFFWLALIIDLANRRINKVYLALLAGTGCAFLVGWYNIGDFFQAAFGVWIYIPFLYSILVIKPFLRAEKHARFFVSALLFASLAGVWWDFFVPFPWTGFIYELGQSLIEASRGWTTFGIDRCAGFSRASFSASNLILFFSIYLACTLKNKFIIVMMWVASGLGLLVTTHKTAIAIYVVLSILIPLLVFYPRTRMIEYCYKILPGLSAIIGICLPFLGGIISVNPTVYAEEFFLSSIKMRLSSTWPDAISLIIRNGNLFLGRGLGGIGAPQLYFQPAYYNPADNMYLSIYASFGIGMIVFVGAWVWGLAKLWPEGRRHDRLFWLFGLAILTSGWMVNGIEDPMTAVAMGLCVSYVLKRNPSQKLLFPGESLAPFTARRCGPIRSWGIGPTSDANYK